MSVHHAPGRGAGGDPRDVQAAARQAGADAQDAALSSKVRIAEPGGDDDIRGIVEVGEQLWGPGGTLAANEFRALVHAGAPVHAAFDDAVPDAPVIGFAVGFLGWSPALHAHSHQAGVLSTHRRRGVGYALKLAQRATCLRFGVTEMRWTFDPLVRRNVAFNLAALGARADAFHVNFYGRMGDAINQSDESDRLEAVWDLSRPLPARHRSGAAAARSSDAMNARSRVVLVDHDGWPRPGESRPQHGDVLEVPADYEVLRRDDPARGAAWRSASRDVLSQAYDAGLRIGAVEPNGYRLVHPEADSDE